MPVSIGDRIRQAASREFVDGDGQPVELELLPPLSPDEIAGLLARLPGPVPDGFREALAVCRGFQGLPAVDSVDFTGESLEFELEAVFPRGLPVAADGFGNFWVLDLPRDPAGRAPVYFACHDPPVIALQAPDLGAFIDELFRTCEPPHESLVHDVTGEHVFEIWRRNAGWQAADDLAKSEDETLRKFVRTLDSDWSIVDLRGARPGEGFSWGRFGPSTEIRRLDDEPVFAIKRPPGLLRRLLGRG